MKPEPTICFPPFGVDLANQQLWRGKKEIFLRQKTFAVLRYLLEHAGQLVTKDELLNALWPSVYVTDMAPMVCIRELREALKDNARQPRFIETLHRRGYRFIAPLTITPPVRSSESGVRSQNFKPTPITQPPIPTLVGREAELAQLHKWLEKALNGERQIIFVTGEAGIGKTALVEMFLAQVRSMRASASSSPAVWIGHGQCIEQFGAGEAYLPILSALGQLYREPEGRQLKAILAQYAPTWLVQMSALSPPEELKALQSRVQGMTRERMLREIAEALEMLTAEIALVLVIEDLHWGDHSTLELLSYLARRRQPARLLIIGTYRPIAELGHDHPLRAVTQELEIHHASEEISLPLLRETEVMAYVMQRFAIEERERASFQPLAQEVYRRTEGNPLFMVSLINHLIGQGLLVQTRDGWTLKSRSNALTDGIPQTLLTMIEQQFEQLSPEDRHVLDVASVAGMEFSAATVAAGVKTSVEDVEERCEELARHRHFLQTEGTIEWPDGTVAARYTFIHALYQNVLYGRITVGRRIMLHKCLGEREEQAYGHQAKEIAAKLAMHFERGRDYQRAVQYLQQAGANAERRNAYTEAVSHFTKGLELLKNLPETSERAQQELSLLVSLGGVLMATKGFAAPEVGETFTRALALSKQAGDAFLLFTTMAWLVAFYTVKGELQTARDLGEQFLCLAQKAQHRVALVAALPLVGTILFYMGELAAAQQHLDKGIALYDPQQDRELRFGGGADPKVNGLSLAAYTLCVRGYPDQALKRIGEARSLAEELVHPSSLVYALGWAAWLHLLRRDTQLVRERIAEIVALATEQGFPLWLANIRAVQGWELVVGGQPKEGIILLRESMAAVRATGAEQGSVYYLFLLAEAYGKSGQIQEALAALDESLAMMNRTQERWMEAELYRLHGELSLRNGETRKTGGKKSSPIPRFPVSSPEESFGKAIEIARRRSAKWLELRAVMSLSRLWQQQGRKKEAHGLLAEIYGWFTEGFDTVDLREARLLLAELEGKVTVTPSRKHGEVISLKTLTGKRAEK